MSRYYTYLCACVVLSLLIAIPACSESPISSYTEQVTHSKWGEIDAALAAGNSDIPGCEAIIRSAMYGSDGFCTDRELESLLLSAETFSAIAAHWRLTYPRSAFRQSWAACGSGAAKEASVAVHRALDDALELLAKRITTKGNGIPIIVFNPLSWTRTDAVVVASPFAGENTGVKITDPDGGTYAARNMGDTLYFTARDVPGIGYKVFLANRVNAPPASGIRAEGSTIENEFFSVYVDSDLGIVRRIRDKETGRDVMPEGGASALLQVVKSTGGREDQVGNTEVVIVDSGPARATISFDHEYGESRFTEEITLCEGVPRIDVRITVDWREAANSLKIAFPTSLEDAEATYALPFGVVRRPKDGRAYSALNWIDIASGDRGVSLIGDGGYGYEVEGSTMRAVLIGSPKPEAEGVYEFTLSLFPHKQDWRQAGAIKRAMELNQPLIARATDSHAGSMPRSQSFISISSDGMVATSVKQEEDGIGTIVRLRETRGQSCEALVRAKFPAQHYIETNALEQPTGEETAIKAGKFTVKLGPQEVRTFNILRR